jgi:DNA-binding NtrC family response regulator
MDKDELADVIIIANQILNMVEENKDIEVKNFEEWYASLLSKYNDQQKALRIIDNAVARFLILYRDKKKEEGLAVSSNIKEEE